MTQLTHPEVRRLLVGHHGLARDLHPPGAAGVRALLARRRAIQLDPLDVIGTNADLVALARLEGVQAGDVYTHILPGHGFEHFAKERCLLPADVFPRYRDHAREVPWWRHNERMRRLDPGLVDDVLAEVADRGPLTAAELSDRGRVRPTDWSGWKGTSKAGTLALAVLWTQCRLVVCQRTPGGKRYDLPARALPTVHDAPASADPNASFALDLAQAAGMLPEAGGPWWGPLHTHRKALTTQLVASGALTRVTVEGTRRTWLVPPAVLAAAQPDPDDRLRILGPLDPLLWDRALIALAFGFRYVWEVYKPAASREWGYYVCPLLHRRALVGRIEARRTPDGVVVDRLWEETPGAVDRDALAAAVARHSEALSD
ncbi:MAG: hypothetical protein ACI8PZ_003204 [Myxococcota bacterium]